MGKCLIGQNVGSSGIPFVVIVGDSSTGLLGLAHENGVSIYDALHAEPRERFQACCRGDADLSGHCFFNDGLGKGMFASAFDRRGYSQDFVLKWTKRLSLGHL